MHDEEEYEATEIRADVDELIYEVDQIESRAARLGMAMPSEWVAEMCVHHHAGMQRRIADLYSRAILLRGRCERSVSRMREIIDRYAWEEIQPMDHYESRSQRMQRLCADCAQLDQSLVLVRLAIDRLAVIR